MVESGGKILIEGSDVADQMIREITAAIDPLRGCVTPLFGVNDKLEPKLVGSAVLISLSDETYLCTAKHVIDANLKYLSTLYFDGSSGLEVLEGDFQFSAEHDVAVLKLTPKQTASFKKYMPLPERLVASQLETERSQYASFVGYPETKNRIGYRQFLRKNTQYAMADMVKSITPTRVHVRFNHKKTVDSDTFQKTNPPNPQGMSGGAIFGTMINLEAVASQFKPRLIGLSTDHDVSRVEMFGATIAVALEIIRYAYGVTLPNRLNS